MKRKINILTIVKLCLILILLGAGAYYSYQFYNKYVYQTKILKKIVARLQADSRIAEVLVSDVKFNPIIQKHITTIKFLEYDSLGQPLKPKYFTFSGNIIQFQSLVVRFEDKLVMAGDALKGKSVYLFWKAFILDGPNTEEFVITNLNEVPEGYKTGLPGNKFEEEIWMRFWEYALDPEKSISKGIKNAQIEAPGTKFIPGFLYTLKIEHDGGIRIDASAISPILKGEKIL